MKKKSIFDYLSSPAKPKEEIKNVESPLSIKSEQFSKDNNSGPNIMNTSCDTKNSKRLKYDNTEVFETSNIENECLSEIFGNENENYKDKLTSKHTSMVKNSIKANKVQTALYKNIPYNKHGEHGYKLHDDEVNTDEVYGDEKSSQLTSNKMSSKIDRKENLASKIKKKSAVNETRFEFLQNIKDKNGNDIHSEFYEPNSLFIDEKAYKNFTPFEKQFWDIKKEYFDTIIFFKKGKFYELYENDADIANKEFGLRITDRVNMKMAGVPETSFDFWSNKFLEKGYKIGRVDQSENAVGKTIRERELKENHSLTPNKKEDKIIKRELKEVITQGTIYNNEHLKSPISFYLAVIKMKKDTQTSHVLLYDASLNTILYNSYCNKDNFGLETLFAQYKIIEVICEDQIKSDSSIKQIKPIKGGSMIKFRDVFENEEQYICFLYLNNYMEYLKRESFLMHVKIKKLTENNNIFMILDATTIKNMDIYESVENNEKTLFETINFCYTNQGKRELRRWLMAPLRNYDAIVARQEAIKTLEGVDITIVKDNLKNIGDIERTASRLFSENPVLKDLFNLINDIEKCNELIYNLSLLLLQNYGTENQDNKIKKLCNNKQNYEQIRDTNKDKYTKIINRNKYNDCKENNKDDVDITFENKTKNKFARNNYNICEKTNFCKDISENDATCDNISNQKAINNYNNFTHENNGNNVYCNDKANKDSKDVYSTKKKETYHKDSFDALVESSKSFCEPETIVDMINSFPDVNIMLEYFKTNYEVTEAEIISLNENDEIQVYIKNLKNIETKLIHYLEDVKKQLKNTSICYKDIGKEIYQLEMSNSIKVNNDYFLVSSTKTHKRYYTNILKMYINEYVECEEKLFQSKGTLLRRVTKELIEYKDILYAVNDIISKIDCYVSLSIYQNLNTNTCYPEFTENEFVFEGLYNPIYKNYVSNDLNMQEKVLILTGPNMGGKSTFLRSVCLNIILSQIGLKVCCKKMKTMFFDRIFTRIGANDNLLKGESTFMIELTETSNILNQCTNKSFLLIDELGRGTSTKDGECIARSVVEYIKNKGVYCLFSTHYHKMVETIENVMKGYMKVILSEDDVVFLYKLVEGICYDSHGIEIARMAGVPEIIVNRAKEIKKCLEYN
ncbi:DNA mismatch repair protein msh6 [Conglomerata obtusa]